MVNQGTISCDVSSGTIALNAQGFTDQGTISANSGDVLSLGTSIFLNTFSPISIQSGGTLNVSGSLLGDTANPGQFSVLGTLILDGAGTASSPQLMEVMSEDVGTSQVGFIHNFSYGSVVLANNTYVELINQYPKFFREWPRSTLRQLASSPCGNHSEFEWLSGLYAGFPGWGHNPEWHSDASPQ